MKLNRIFIYLAAALSLSAVSCVKESPEIVTYPRNEGEEYLSVSVDTLSFLGRGNTLQFSVEASYDGTIEGADWVTLTSREFPGDKRAYTFSATVEANSTGADRKEILTVSTPNITKTIVVLQPAYNRPAIPEVIKTGAEFKTFLEELAPFVETGETITIGGTIDMEGLEVVPAEYFNGILEGDGNRIVNMKASCPLITRNNGTICNLTIDESCAFTMVPASSDVYLAPFTAQNYGVVESCENDADITISGDYSVKTYAGGITAYTYDGSTVKNCTNKGEIKFIPTSSSANAYLGGITGYSYGNVDHNDNYGPITCEPVAMTGAYFMAGISPRHQTGSITYNVNHKEATIYANKLKGAKSYVGCIIGYLEGHPSCGYNECYNDLDFRVTTESYVGGLQGWQAKVEDADATLFEGSIVNCNIKAHTAGKGANGTNPCNSAGFVTGRFSGQSGKKTLHYGTADKPIRVSGSITCLANNTKLVASAKAYTDLLDGDGSKSSVNLGAVPEADYNTIQYEVVGDGQTGPSEELIVTTDPIKLEVPMTGGKTSFIFKANYDATVSTSADWISFSESEAVAEKVIPAADGEQTVEIFAAANSSAQDREGKVSIALPMGSYKEITISQPGNKVLDPTVAVSQESFTAQPAGDALSFTVTSNYDATITSDSEWLTVSPATTKGGDAARTVNVTVAKNNGADAALRNGTITVSVSNFDSPAKTVTKTIAVSQEKFVYIPKTEIATVDDFMDFVEYGADAELYPSDFVVKLTADIDLKGKTVKSITPFVATFDGQGHSLKNWTCEGPLFGQVKNCVKNLVIDSSCKANLKFENAIANGSNKCIGVICGDLLAGSIEGCTNNAAITLATFGTDPTFIGAMTGRSQASAMVKGCVNNGAITVKPTAAISASYRVAGIVGGSNGNVQDCKNNAPVELSPVDVTGGNHFLGGIAAYLAKNADQTLAGCVNTKNGKVTFNPTTVTSIAQSYVGGVLGYLDGQLKADTNFSNDKNFGDVYSSANVETVAVGGLLGWSKAGGNPNNLLFGSVVNCNVTAGFASTDAVNPCQSAGLVIGRVALSGEAANVTAVCGSEDQPIKVAGSVTLVGGKTVTADATNFLELCKGAGFADTNNKFHLTAIFEAVTKE